MGLSSSKAAKVVAVAAAAPLLVLLGVGMMGFGAGGIAAGSLAAALMSTYGGMVPAASLCAVLQSVGAGGLATSTIMATEGVAAALAAVSGLIFFKRDSAPADVPDAPSEGAAADSPDAPAAPPDVAEEEEMVVEELDHHDRTHASSISSPEAAPLFDNPFAQDPSALKL